MIRAKSVYLMKTLKCSIARVLVTIAFLAAAAIAASQLDEALRDSGSVCCTWDDDPGDGWPE